MFTSRAGSFARASGSATSTTIVENIAQGFFEHMKKAKKAKKAATQPGAPALEKGLDLLEALASESSGLSQKQLAERVGRSVGEIFRMLGALERRGYVTRDPSTAEYTLTLKLFRIASQFPPTERLLQAALPVMEQLAGRVQLSCHLAVLHGEQFMVIARIEPEWLMGWSVKVGAVFPLTQQYASAKVLAAFQLEGRRNELAEVIAAHDHVSGRKALAALDRISSEGGNFSNDDGYTRILAYSCPIIEASGRAVAALTVPLVRQDKIPAAEAVHIAAELRKATKLVSEKIGGST
jgi:DNA-binding IclR family transcriptional regulator